MVEQRNFTTLDECATNCATTAWWVWIDAFIDEKEDFAYEYVIGYYICQFYYFIFCSALYEYTRQNEFLPLHYTVVLRTFQQVQGGKFAMLGGELHIVDRCMY
jgi:hypothetical protein